MRALCLFECGENVSELSGYPSSDPLVQCPNGTTHIFCSALLRIKGIRDRDDWGGSDIENKLNQFIMNHWQGCSPEQKKLEYVYWFGELTVKGLTSHRAASEMHTIDEQVGCEVPWCIRSELVSIERVGTGKRSPTWGSRSCFSSGA